MKILTAAALAAALAACAPAMSSKPMDRPYSAGADKPLPPPKAGAVTIDLRKEDAGKTFTMKVGQRFSVSLVGVPTAGYLWAPVNPPAFLKAVGDTSGPTHSDQLKPGFAGGNHWEVSVFEATQPGKAILKFEQRRPWEKTEPPADTWSATIEVK